MPEWFHSPFFQSPDRDQPLSEAGCPTSRQPGLDQHSTAGERSMNQRIGIGGKGHVRDADASVAAKEQQIARLGRLQRD
jgi:hypothetical protein